MACPGARHTDVPPSPSDVDACFDGLLFVGMTWALGSILVVDADARLSKGWSHSAG